MRLVILLVVVHTSLSSFSQTESSIHQLEHLILRSYHIKKEHSLVGIKGKTGGEGLVYYRKLNTDTWIATNNGKSLDPKVADVQAVAVVNDSIFLAGTWKNGMFRTENSGDTWQPIISFPSNDIRSIKVINSNLIYAATTTKGILQSKDMGISWTAFSPDSLSKELSSWAIKIDPLDQSTLYALTFSNGIQKSSNQGENWTPILKHEGVRFYDLAISKKDINKLWAVGSNDSIGVIYTSKDRGTSWKLLTKTPKARFNLITITGNNEDVILAGSWDAGVFVYSNTNWTKVKEVPFDTISGIHADAKAVTFLTWGNGLYKMKNLWIDN